MEVILQVLKRADHLIGGRLYTLEGMDLIVGKNDRIMLIINMYHRELADILPDALKIVAGTLGQGGRHAECCDDTCDGGVDSGIQHQIPENYSEDHIQSLLMAFEDIRQYHHRNADA